MIKQLTGLCPITNNTETVDVIYKEFNQTGKLTPSYKLIATDCEHSSECPYKICSLVKK